MNRKEFKKILTEYIADDQDGLNRHNKIMEVFKQNEGKQFNKHLENRLPEGYSLYVKAGMYHIKSRENKVEKEHLCGYLSHNHTVSSERFVDNDRCHGTAAQERIDKVNAVLLNKEKFEQAYKKFSDLSKMIKKVKEQVADLWDGEFDSYNFPPFYFILNAIDKDVDFMNLKYGKR